MHDCQTLRENLTDYIFGTASSVLDTAMDSELKSCEKCFTFFQDAAAIRKIVDSAPAPPELSEQYWHQFGIGLRAKLEHGRTSSPAVGTIRGPRLQWVLFAVAASVIVTVTSMLFRTT